MPELLTSSDRFAWSTTKFTHQLPTMSADPDTSRDSASVDDERELSSSGHGTPQHRRNTTLSEGAVPQQGQTSSQDEEHAVSRQRAYEVGVALWERARRLSADPAITVLTGGGQKCQATAEIEEAQKAVEEAKKEMTRAQEEAQAAIAGAQKHVRSGLEEAQGAQCEVKDAQEPVQCEIADAQLKILEAQAEINKSLMDLGKSS